MIKNYKTALFSILIFSFSSKGAYFEKNDFFSFNVEKVISSESECENFKKSLPPEMIQDSIEVPENWDGSHSPKIKVFYYYRDFKFFDSNVLPTLFLNGGPGANSHQSYRTLFKRPEFNEIPFVFMDQRGNGCSSPYPFTTTKPADLKRIRQYGTRSIVKDAEAIRKKLFLKKWNLFGQSYGGYISFRYLILFPHSISKSFIHGSSLMDNGVLWTEYRMLAQRRAGLEYLKDYPNDLEIINRVKSQIPSTFCTKNFAIDPQTNEKKFIDQSCGDGLVDGSFYGILSIGKNYWKFIHDRISKLLDEKGNVSEAFLNQFSPDQLIDSSDVGRTFNMFIGNTRDVPGGLALNWACRLAYNNLIKNGYDPKSWLFSECYSELTWDFVGDSILRQEFKKDYIKLSDLKKSLRHHKELNLYLYSSYLDGYVAEESFQEMVHSLGLRIHYTAFKESGHGGWFFEDQIYKDLLGKSL